MDESVKNIKRLLISALVTAAVLMYTSKGVQESIQKIRRKHDKTVVVLDKVLEDKEAKMHFNKWVTFKLAENWGKTSIPGTKIGNNAGPIEIQIIRSAYTQEQIEYLTKYYENELYKIFKEKLEKEKIKVSEEELKKFIEDAYKMQKKIREVEGIRDFVGITTFMLTYLLQIVASKLIKNRRGKKEEYKENIERVWKRIEKTLSKRKFPRK